MVFQCNERYLKWDDSAQRQLLRLTVADKLDIVRLQCNDNNTVMHVNDTSHSLPCHWNVELHYIADVVGFISNDWNARYLLNW